MALLLGPVLYFRGARGRSFDLSALAGVAGVAVLKWMAGFTLAMNVAILFFVWQIMLRLPG